MSQIQSKTISLLRFPLIVAVVFIHTHAGVYSSLWLSVLLSEVITQIAVPIYFFMSGYLFFKGVEKFSIDVYLNKISKRWHSLIIPFIFWTLIAILPYVAKGFYLTVNNSASCVHPFLSLYNIDTWISGPFNYHLWFLRELIIAVLLSPVLYTAIRKYKRMAILLLLVLYMIDLRQNTSILSTQSLLFFALGGYFGLGDIDFVEVFKTKIIVLFTITVLLSIVAVCAKLNSNEYALILLKVLIVIGVPCVLALASFFANRLEPIKLLSDSSFFVYLSHVYIIPVTGVLTSKLYMIDNIYINNITFLLRPLVISVICVGIYWGANKTQMKWFKILVGNR